MAGRLRTTGTEVTAEVGEIPGATPPADVVNDTNTTDSSRAWRGPRALAARWRAPWSARRVWVFWLVSRALLLALVWAGHALGGQQGVLGDIGLYDGWGTAFVHGHGLPDGDQKWQYPPAAVLVFAVPALAHAATGLSYRVGFPLLMMLLDAAVTAALARTGRGPGTLPGPGARVWLVGAAVLGPVTLARFDLVPAACALAGLLALAARAGAGGGGPRDARAGAAIALGTLVKVWPAFLLVALGRVRLTRTGRLALGAAVAVAAVAAVLVAAGAGSDLLGFLGAQKARGLQLEAVPASAFVVVRMFGSGETARYEYGSLQFGDATARAVATACSLVEIVLVVAAVLWWWLPRPAADGEDPGPGAVRTADRLLALLLVVLVTSRVLSPQYLVWVLAVAAALVALGGTAGGGEAAARRRELVALLLVIALVSHVVYPWRYNDVIQGRVVMGVVLVARNVLVVLACWKALVISVPRGSRGRRGRAPRTR